MKKINLVSMALLMVVALNSCEKAVVGDNEKQQQEDGVPVVFNIDKFEQTPFDDGINVSRTATDVSTMCTQINVAVFSGDDKVKGVNQKAGDNSFGTVSVSLAKGTYRLVVMAHSCNGAATITTPDKITFPDNKVTDTFYYYGEITIDDAKAYSLELKRAVAMFRLVAEDGKPESVKSMKFYYSGGSSTFDAVTGYGCVNSRQTEIRTVDDSLNGKQTQYDVYTFPHDESGMLKMTVTALDNAGNTVTEKVFDDVPVKLKTITKYTGTFFSASGGASSSSLSFAADNAWSEDNHTY